MTDQFEFPSLHGWQSCLAVSEKRLARPDFALDMRHAFAFVELGNDAARPESWELTATAKGLSVEVLRSGRDLVKLRMNLAGTLKCGERIQTFRQASCDFVTSFHVVRTGTSCEIVADLADVRGRENVTTAECDEVDLEIAVRHWAEACGRDHTIRLFAFDTGTGESAGARFDRFAVTTSFAETASVHSSLLLLMGNASAPSGDTPAVFDPHILPQGETAVLWVDHDTLVRSCGLTIATAASIFLSMRPRRLGVELMDLKLPGWIESKVTPALLRWTRSVIDNVGLPEALDFTSAQMSSGGLKLSATPLSLAELDELTANDLTIGRKSLVEEKANQLFSDCVLYHVDDLYRGKLLGMEKPNLSAEVETIARPYASWLAAYGRVQIAHVMKSQHQGDLPPFNRLSADKIAAKLKELSGQNECRELIQKLYPVAFCLVRPRLSLYLDARDIWFPRYRDYLTSMEYRDGLERIQEPAAKLHDDAAKLRLLDTDGKATDDIVLETSSWLLGRDADRNWKTVATAHPAEFRVGLQRVLAGLHAATEPGAVADDWVARAGGARRVAEQWIPALAAEAANPRVASLKDMAREFAAVMRWTANGVAHGLSYAAGAAVIAILLAPAQAMAATGAVGDLQPFVEGTASTFATVASGGLLVTAELQIGARTIAKAVTLVIKGLHWISRKIEQGAATMLRFFGTNVGKMFARAGAFLALCSFALSVWDMVEDWKQGHVWETVLDGLMALASALSFFVLIMAPAGPWGTVLMVAGLALGVISLLIRLLRKTEEEAAADDLTKAMATLGLLA